MANYTFLYDLKTPETTWRGSGKHTWPSGKVASEAGLITLFTTIAFVWMGLLLFCATMITHDYSMGKNLITFVGTIVGIAFIMFIAILFSTLVAKLISLITNIVTELEYRA